MDEEVALEIVEKPELREWWVLTRGASPELVGMFRGDHAETNAKMFVQAGAIHAIAKEILVRWSAWVASDQADGWEGLVQAIAGDLDGLMCELEIGEGEDYDR